jgi:hypothetical protein
MKFNSRNQTRIWYHVPTKTMRFVIRTVDSFHYDNFKLNVAKYVRKNHIQTNEHWSKNWVKNNLKQDLN